MQLLRPGYLFSFIGCQFARDGCGRIDPGDQFFERPASYRTFRLPLLPDIFIHTESDSRPPGLNDRDERMFRQRLGCCDHIQCGNSHHRQIARQRNSLHQGQPDSQTRKRTRTHGNAQSADHAHRNAAPTQKSGKSRGKFCGVMLPGYPRHLAEDLVTIIQRQAGQRSGCIDCKEHGHPPTTAWRISSSSSS